MTRINPFETWASFYRKLLRIVIAAILLLNTSGLSAQMVFKFTSKPDSAVVRLNGEVVGRTPCEVKKGWKSGSVLVFDLSLDGYKTETVRFSEKPSEFVTESHSVLVRNWNFTIDSASAVVDFDKVTVGFNEDKEIGFRVETDGSKAPIVWGKISKPGEEGYRSKSNDVLGAAGFKTPYILSTQLFSDQQSRPQAPRFIVGAQLLDVQYEIIYDKKAAAGPNRYQYKVVAVVDFKVLDKSTKKVLDGGVFTGIDRGLGSFFPKESFVVDAYNDAFEQFLLSGELAKWANEGKKKPKASGDDSRAEIKIPKVEHKSFGSASEMISQSTLSCVTIETDIGHGSGFFVEENGKILTAHHVISGVNSIEVILSSGLKLEAKVIAENEDYDIALLSIPGSGYVPFPIESANSAGPGAEVFTIGTPLDIELGQSVSKGIVSGKRKVEDIIYIQTDVSVSPGNSGGPLINSKGSCIGIIQRKLVAFGVEGVGFALPIETALKEIGITIQE